MIFREYALVERLTVMENVLSGLRESAILGLVGAGGIGLQLQAFLNVLAWPQVTLISIVILGTVVVSEWVSARVRRAII